MPDDTCDWLVWEGESKTWWKPNRCGYTASLLQAGLYPEREAKEIESFSDRFGRQDKAIHISEQREIVEEMSRGIRRLELALNARTIDAHEQLCDVVFDTWQDMGTS